MSDEMREDCYQVGAKEWQVEIPVTGRYPMTCGCEADYFDCISLAPRCSLHPDAQEVKS